MPAVTYSRTRLGGVAVLLILLAHASSTEAQDAVAAADEPRASRVETAVRSLAGAALGLGIHEGGHLTFDLLLGTTPGLERVSYAGIPFFAITHDPVSPAREFTISSAGFWSQHLSSEWLLTRHPRLRYERAPLRKGMLAFNVLVSVMYAGAAIGRTGPDQRDTRGMAVSARMAEPWVAPVILAPAVLDTLRYLKPESRAARWASRAAKVGGVLLVLRARP
ncbi:MAG: hypothetical protein ABL986_00860 [Vicinamibacterales bacterium]